ncbi:MAG: TonB family protein, partial [Spirulinaceae cyanobacterium SM2_1_0]|nr:TonB family protein [Spirulinaceae cyanobacterium SM2_1_0]
RRRAAAPPPPDRSPASPLRPVRRGSDAPGVIAGQPRFSLQPPVADSGFQLRTPENPGTLLPGRRPAERADETRSVQAASPEATNPSPTPTSTRPLSPQEVAARQQQEREAAALARIQAERQRLRANTRDTREQDVQRNEENWRNVAPQPPRSLSLAGVYPRAACLQQLAGTAVYGVTVNPDGRVSDVRVIQGAGRDIFNQQARSQVLNHRYATADSPIPYRVSVSFRYDAANCPTLTVPSPSATPAPEGAPEAEAQ